MMKGFYFLVFFIGLATAAIQQTGPVYRSASVVNATPVKQQQNQQSGSPQPNAEERESPAYQTSDTVVKPSSAASPTASTAPSPTSVYTVAYYPNQTPVQHQQPQYHQSAVASPSYSQPGNYQQAGTYQQSAANPSYQQLATGYQQGTSPVYQQGGQAVDFWTKYHVADILVGGAAFGMFALGSGILYQKFPTFRARALRELSDLNADDASRMVKGVMRALEKYYDIDIKNE